MELIKPENLQLTHTQFMLFLPYFIIMAGAMLSLVVGVSKRLQHTAALKFFCLITTVCGLYFVTHIWGEPGTVLFNKMLAADYFSNLFNLVFIIATALVMLSSYSYLAREGIDYFEYYGLLLFACLGMMLLASALDLVVLFISLEIMSIAVYVLVGFRRADPKSNEAALKYFILGSVASAVFLYGVALIYGASGTMNIHEILSVFTGTAMSAATATAKQPNALFIIGTILLIVGFLFKIAAVPFHMWMPDVYEGAPTTVTNFMTTGLKAAAIAAFLRVFVGLGLADNVGLPMDTQNIHHVLWVIAVITMFLGNVVALTQRNVKRMLAYSSIAHTGYMIVGFIAGAKSEMGYAPVVIYIVSYVVMNLGAFAIASLLTEKGDHYTDIHDYAGLGYKQPLLGFAMLVFMFSMSGMPLTVGFIGKYMIFSAAVQSGEILLTVLAVLCSAISAYYYLRVVVYMYMRESVREFQPRYAFSALFVIAVTTIMTLQFGVFPSMLIQAARKAAMNL